MHFSIFHYLLEFGIWLLILGVAAVVSVLVGQILINYYFQQKEAYVKKLSGTDGHEFVAELGKLN